MKLPRKLKKECKKMFHFFGYLKLMDYIWLLIFSLYIIFFIFD